MNNLRIIALYIAVMVGSALLTNNVNGFKIPYTLPDELIELLNENLKTEALKFDEATFITLSEQEQQKVFDTIASLIEQGANPDVVIREDITTVPATPLYLAVLHRIPAAVAMLLDHGASIEYIVDDPADSYGVNITDLASNQFVGDAILPPEFFDSPDNQPYAQALNTILALLVPDRSARKQAVLTYVQNEFPYPETLEQLNNHRKNAIDLFYEDRPEQKPEIEDLTQEEILDAVESHFNRVYPGQNIAIAQTSEPEEELMEEEEEVPTSETMSEEEEF